MRIAYICADPGVPVFGCKGASVHVQSVIRALLRRGAQVDLFAACGGGDPPPGLEEVMLHRLPCPPRGDLAAREAALLATNHALTAMLAHAGHFDLIYERYSLWSYAGMEYARGCRCPGLLEVNAPLIAEQAHHRGLLNQRGAEQVAWRVFGAATALLAVSREIAAYLASYATMRGRVHVVPNGVDPERFSGNRTPTLPAPPGVLTVGFAGTLKPWHGLDTLLEAFARMHRHRPATRLLLVGDGPERTNIKTRAAQLNLQNALLITGLVDPRAVPGLLYSMDMATAPYPPLGQCYFSPLKLFEYIAAGLPIAASRIGQTADVLVDEHTGLLCPPGDVAALADALVRLSSDVGLRQRMGDNARQAVSRKHTWDAVAARILALADCGTRQEQVYR